MAIYISNLTRAPLQPPPSAVLLLPLLLLMLLSGVLLVGRWTAAPAVVVGASLNAETTHNTLFLLPYGHNAQALKKYEATFSFTWGGGGGGGGEPGR